MEPPPLSSTVAAAAVHHINYPDSVESSPRSRNADCWDDSSFPSLPGAGPKLRLMCSYGGHIVPRPHDKSLCYVGGDTRIVVSYRCSSLSDLTHRLSKTLLNGKPFTLKYQLPNEDLDSLISVTTDEDLDNMIEEYDRLNSNAAVKSSRLRLFLFLSKPESIGSLPEDSTKSEDWLADALNGSSSRGLSESASVNCLLGLDEDALGNSNSEAATGKDVKAIKGRGVNVHSVPGSPMLEKSSSFGSTSSSPSLASLPPIRVHVTDDQTGGGIEEKFAHLSVVAPVSSPLCTTVLTTVAARSGVSGEYSNRVLSDDERSAEGMGYGYRKLPHQSQPHQPPQLQTKPIGLDLASPDSISSDSSLANPLYHQRPLIFQEPVVQNAFPVDPKLSEPNTRVQLQQVQDSGCLLLNQFDQHHQQLNQLQQQQLNQQHQQQLNQQHQQQLDQQLSQHHHPHQQQLNQQQQQQLSQQQQQQLNQQHQQQLDQQLSQHHHHHQQLNQQQQQLNQQQFLQAGTRYTHHHPIVPVPITSYYQLYPPQQQPLHQPDQQYHNPMYYLPTARQSQPYNFVVQQPDYNESTTTNTTSSLPQTPPTPSSGMPMPPPPSYTTTINPPAAFKPELATGMYRTATSAVPPSAQHQQQYVGFSQIHHHRPSHSAAGNSGNPSAYAYEFVDPAQLYYPQTMTPQLAAQYQTMTSGPTMVLPEASTHLPTDNTKQQIRTSQP